MNMCVLFCSLRIILPYLICFSQWAYQVWGASLESSFCRWEESASELQQPAQGHSSGKYQGQELKNRTAGSKFCAFFHWNILPVWSHDSSVNQSFRKKKIFWLRWHQGAESNSVLGLPGKGAAKITGLTRTWVQMRKKMPSQDSHELLTESPGTTAKASWPRGGWMVRGWTTLWAEQKEGVCCRDRESP